MKKKLVVLTGAGMSAESGISTFRDSDGLWEKYRVEDVATPEGFASNPELVLNFYNQRRRELLNTKPNAGHIGLAELEKNFDVHIITQNIDNLHEQAGSSDVIHLHGELMKACSVRDLNTTYDLSPENPDIHIGDTICTPNNPESIPFQKISEPTIAMYFMVNDSPLAGQEGKYITSRHLRDRLFRELNTDVSLRVEETDSADCFKVSGRGELHLSVLIENMRREGFEFAVSKAEVLYKYDERNRKLEPMELAYVDVPEEYTGVVIQKLTSRKGALQGMSQAAGGYSRLEFSIPSRGLIGYRGDFMTDTKGNGILNTIFDGYSEYKGDLFYRQTGSLIAFEAGEAITYGLFNAQERGTLFIGPGVKVYSGMVVGQSPKAEDIEINVCKTKKLTNTRSSSADEALKLTPPKIMSLEQALDFIDTDELLEVTPESLRIRKKILDPTLRKRASFKNK